MGGREAQEGGDIYIYIYTLTADLYSCTAETNTIL